MVEQMKPGSGGPEDKFKMVYIIFYWLGIGTLLPWNMFISVSSYFSVLLMINWRICFPKSY